MLKYDPTSPRWLAQLTVSTFKRLGQYASRSGNKAYCYAELAIFFPSGGRTIPVFILPTHRGMARLSWPGWLIKY